MPLVVSDSGPLIAYAVIGRLELIARVFTSVSIPEVVAGEIHPSIPELPDWIVVLPAPRRSSTPMRPSLDPGELEAIELALHIGADLVVMDDLAARAAATRLGLRITGSAGIAVAAKLRGVIPAARPLIDELRAAGLYLGDAVYKEALAMVDER